MGDVDNSEAEAKDTAMVRQNIFTSSNSKALMSRIHNGFILHIGCRTISSSVCQVWAVPATETESHCGKIHTRFSTGKHTKASHWTVSSALKRCCRRLGATHYPRQNQCITRWFVSGSDTTRQLPHQRFHCKYVWNVGFIAAKCQSFWLELLQILINDDSFCVGVALKTHRRSLHWTTHDMIQLTSSSSLYQRIHCAQVYTA